MLTAVRAGALILILALGVALCVFSVANSSTYQTCIQLAGQDVSNPSGADSPPRTVAARSAFRCAGDFVEQNGALAITALSTVVIAIFTAILGSFAISLARSHRWRRSPRNLSARTALALELPILRASAGQLGYGYKQDEASRQHHVTVGVLVLSNLGKTKAFPSEVQIGCTIGHRLRRTPVYRYAKPFPINAIIEPGQSNFEVSLSEFEFDAPPDIYNLLRARSTDLWFYCNVVYYDFMQTRRQAGFCWKRQELTGMGAPRRGRDAGLQPQGRRRRAPLLGRIVGSRS